MKKPSKNETKYRNPKIHSDLMLLFRHFFGIHRSLNKYLRITILEEQILNKITEAMRLTIEISAFKSAASSSYVYERSNCLRGHLENISAFTFLLSELRAISEGFYIQVAAEIESISKQIVGWQKHLLGPKHPANPNR